MLTRMITAAVMLAAGIFGVGSIGSIMGTDAEAASENEFGKLQRIVLGLDLSMSNPLVTDKAYAAKLGQRVADEIEGLSPRSEIWVRSFGVYDPSSNPLRFNEVISAKNRPEDVGKGIETLVSNLPKLMQDGVIKGQAYTNIVAFLENMTQVIDCSDGMETRFILLTDGIEDSEYGNLRRANSKLPDNTLRTRGQCYELQILGIGQGLGSPSETQRLRTVWSDWATGDDTKPFASFVGLNDW